MANIETLQEKVQKAEEKVDKCKGTIVRHEKQKDKKIDALVKKGINLVGLNKQEVQEIQFKHGGTDLSWEISDVKNKLEDIKGATKKLQDAEGILNNWQAKLELEIEKERFLNDNAPQVIKEFIEQWKNLAYEWYVKRYNDYQELKASLEAKKIVAYKEIGIQESRFPSRSQEQSLKELGLDYSSIRDRKTSFAGAIVLRMDEMYKETERLEWLDKQLEAEKKAKLLDLVNRINAVVGTITDAKGLSISEVGNLNGVVVGEKASAKVETIGAGGWNIQVFHYRTLVHKV